MKSFLKSCVYMFAFVGFLLVSAIILILVAVAENNAKDVAVDLPESMVIAVHLDGVVTDLMPADTGFDLAGLLSDIESGGADDGTISLYELKAALEMASSDPAVKGILFSIGDLEIGLAQIQELEPTLRTLRKNGKYLVAYTDSFGEASPANGAYAFASFANEIWVQGGGVITLTDYNISQPYFGAVFERFGIGFEHIAREGYKSAVDNIIRTDMSPENRENTTALLSGLNQDLVNIIQQNRPIKPEVLHKRLALASPFMTATAMTESWIDHTGTVQDAEDALLTTLKATIKTTKTEVLKEDIVNLRYYYDAKVEIDLSKDTHKNNEIVSKSDKEKPALPDVKKLDEKAKPEEVAEAKTEPTSSDLIAAIPPETTSEEETKPAIEAAPESKAESVAVVDTDTNTDTPLVSITRLNEPVTDNKGRILVVALDGVIDRGGGEIDPFAEEGTIGSLATADLLREIEDMTDVKGVVIRLTSPGGSAVASETIRLAVLRLKAKGIPVVVSMGYVVASGGYWIASSADKIIAQPATITGSIGVVSLKPDLSGLWAKQGIKWADVSGGIPLTDPETGKPMPAEPSPWSMSHGYTKAQRAEEEGVIDAIYGQFLQIVAEGRKMDVASVKAIAGGRVWTGRQALEIGLVDKLGGLDTAITEAVTLSKLPESELEISQYPVPLTDWEAFLELLNSELGTDIEINSMYSKSQLQPKTELGFLSLFKAMSQVWSIWSAQASASQRVQMTMDL